MSALSSHVATLLTLAAAGIGCGGGESEPPPQELTSVEVTPASGTLFTAQPGNTVELTVVAKDQDGQPMNEVGSTSFSSDNQAVGTVDPDGIVTAIGAGSARITVSVTAGGVTKAGVADVKVQVAPAAASVTAPQFAFLPDTTDVSAGGTVTWFIGAIHHTVTFTSSGAPADIPVLQAESASRTFPTSGTFAYRCTIHAAMAGTVRVH
jgi:plastocyanin